MPRTLHNVLQRVLAMYTGTDPLSSQVDEFVAICGSQGLTLDIVREPDIELIPKVEQAPILLKNAVDVFHGSFKRRAIFADAATLNCIYQHYFKLDRRQPNKRLYTPLHVGVSNFPAGYHLCRYLPDQDDAFHHDDASIIVLIEINPFSLAGRADRWDVRHPLSSYYSNLIEGMDLAEIHLCGEDGMLQYMDLKSDSREIVQVI